MNKKKLQIFISSTFTDLVDERQAAVAAVLKAGHIPAGMELFKSGDKSQLETIKKWIDDCDVYMLILGGRYGTVEPVSGKSYTELEYDYALERGMRVFSVVITEDALEVKVKAGGTSFMEKENPKLLAVFREKVLSNISSFFSDDKDIKLCVHESLSELALDKSLIGWVSGAELKDTSSLIEQNQKLVDDNERLAKELDDLKKKKAAAESKSEKKQELSELIEILYSRKITVPAEICGEPEPQEVRVGDVFFSVKNDLIGGVENSVNSSKPDIYIFYNVCPILEMYGLVASEKVAGVKYRRFSTTKLGKEVLFEIDKRLAKMAEKAEKATKSESGLKD